ncbi:hypothetical protein NYE70_23675 [Paenibacillus sp. FSL R5-0407]|uniref:hypothetical protein n=1 Tax=Paenibacillus sp. FSL R5-0407 TaxID=2975320 RepID=UPI0030FCD1BD
MRDKIIRALEADGHDLEPADKNLIDGFLDYVEAGHWPELDPHNMNPLEQVITVSEAARIADITVRTVQRKCKAGEYDARITDDGVWLILKTSVEKSSQK